MFDCVFINLAYYIVVCCGRNIRNCFIEPEIFNRNKRRNSSLPQTDSKTNTEMVLLEHSQHPINIKHVTCKDSWEPHSHTSQPPTLVRTDLGSPRHPCQILEAWWQNSHSYGTSWGLFQGRGYALPIHFTNVQPPNVPTSNPPV